MGYLKIALRFFVIIFIIQGKVYSQCPSPGINAQAGTGPSTTICSGQCANLTATVIPPPNSTTNYSVGAITYSTYPYFGGSNAFATTLDDTWSDVIDIGFNFCYFGNTYNKLVVGSNGEITFNLASANMPESWITTQVLPNLVEHPPNTICGPYRDYNPYPGGVIRTYTTGVAPCRAFIVYYSSVTLFSCSTPLSSFQIVLYESSNMIGVNIQNSTACLSWNSGRGLVGIQNGTGTFAVAPPGRNVLTPWTAINESWCFTPTAAPVYTVGWTGPSGFTASGLTATPCPTATGNYTATMSYCSGSVSSVVQVQVNTPTVSASASSNTICPPASATLTGSGATSYTWQTPSGNIVGSTTVVSPTTTTTYTLLGSNGACTGSTTIQITVNPAPVVSAFNLSGTVCPGNPATLVGTGAISYTWYAGGMAGNIITVTPTVTTTYTVVGSLGSCTSQATVITPVSSGPSILTIASPSAICPGGSSTLTASGALSYTWNPGGTISNSIIVSPALTTTYSVTGTDVLGCTSTKTISLIVNTIPSVTISPVSPSICIGTSATLTASGASGYTWSPGGSNAASIIVSPVTNTTYTLLGSNGTCTNSTTKTLTVVPVPTLSASSSTTSVCAGNSLTLTASGASTYTWNPGNISGTSVTVSPTITTTYTVIGSSGTCTSSAVVSVTVNNAPAITANASPSAICPGNSSTLTASGALSYTWNPGGLTGSSVAVNPPATTIYSVNGSNASGCTTTQTVSLTVSPVPSVISSSSSSSICIGSNATLTATGASGYTWNPGALTGSNVIVSPVTNTTYTVIGSNGACTGTATIGITVVPIPTVSASGSSTSICSGSSLTLTSSGASSYSWNPGNIVGANATVSPTITTNYTVTGLSGNCTGSAVISVSVNNGPPITMSANPGIICSGSGSTLTASGALSYTWSPGALTGSIISVTPSSSTVYSVVGTNGSGCTTTQTVSLTVTPNPTITLSSTSTSVCIGGNATLTANGATNYTWSPGALTGSNIVVTPTSNITYTVNGTLSGCPAQTTITINVVPAPTITAVSNPTIICNGNPATLTASGASSYTWNPGGFTGTTISVSPSITTTYTATGSNGSCSSATTVVLTVNPSPTISSTASPTSICVSGTVTLTANGASTYTWMPGALSGSTVVVSPTITTTYTLTGTSASGCVNTVTTAVVVNTVPVLTLVASPTIICNGSSSTLTANGASSYTWMPGTISGSSIVVSPSVTTTYTVTGVTGACSGTQTLNLVVNPNPTVTASASPSNICAGSSSTLTATGASSFTWNPGASAGASIAVTQTSTTVYTVTGSTPLGCSNTATLNLIVSPVPTITATSNPTTICNGNSATLSASGATSYTWNPGALTGNTVIMSPSVTTTYTVFGAMGICNTTQTVSLNVNSLPVLSAAANAATLCAGMASTLNATGASSYTWNPGALTGSNVTVTPTITTTYSVSGTNTLGCTNSTTVSVTVNALPSLTITSTATAICAGNSATLTGNGASTYTWSPGGANTTTLLTSPSVTTNYTLAGSSAAGCSNSAMYTLSVVPVPTITAVANPTTICSGNSSTLSANGASSYTWNPGALTGSNVIVSPVLNTTYTVTGANGFCTNSQTVSVNVNPAPSITTTASSPTICYGGTTTLIAVGGTSYSWSPGALSGSSVAVSPTLTTTYTVVSNNALGCSSTKTLMITVTPLPTLSIASTAATLCSGNSATLTGSGASTYTWNPGGSISASLIVTPGVTSTYTLTGSSLAGCSNSKTITVNVTITPTLTASASNTLLCTGNSATLTASGATSFTWNPGALTGTTIVVSPTVNTMYTLMGSNGACSSTAAISLSVNPSPTITASSNPSVMCSGNTATITANGASSYTWMPSGAITSSVQVNPTITTIYTVSGTGINGCVNTIPFTLSVTPTPTVTAASTSSSICLGGSATLTANGANSYTWNPGALSGTSIVVSPTITTSYTVNGVNGSCSNSAIITITVNALPVITANASPVIICAGSNVTLSSSGANTYTWSPIGISAATVNVLPNITTTYTVTGTNTNGCKNTANITVSVNPSPTITTVISSPTICAGNPATLTASGANTYTWNPGSVNGSVITVTPGITITYTVSGTNLNGCSNTQTVQLVVQPSPTVTAFASSTAICFGNSATLTANGAATYTWQPGLLTNSTVVVTPSTSIIYTLTGANGICGSGTTTISLTVNTQPTVSASVNGSITCTTPSVTLTGSSSATSSGYFWNGPGSFTSAMQSPTGIALAGTYTLSVIDLNTGCTGSNSVAVLSNSSVPTISISVTSTITCANPSATVMAMSSATNPSYNWFGPGTFTGSSQSFTTGTGGTYTVTITDLSSNCPASTAVTIITNTSVPISATIVPATCSGTMTNNNGSILTSGFVASDKYDLVGGLTYTGTATYTTAANIPLSGMLTNTLSNPSLITPYTIRFFSSNGCTKDTTLFLVPTSCISNTVFGIAKAVSTPTLKTNGTYDVNYFVIIKNSGVQTLDNITLNENLFFTFPLPTTYSITNAPVVTSLNSSITINSSFNGSLQTVMTNSTSMLAPGKTDTIMFSVNLTHNGNFGPFKNTVLGFASPAAGVVFGDSSNTGYNTDPDLDNNPTNNNIPTILNLTPNLFFGLTKQGALSSKLSDDSWDITYTVTVHNLGNDTLKNITVKDSLFNNTIKFPATYNMRTAPLAGGSLTGNPAYNGNTDINLLSPALSKLAPGSVNSIVFTINVSPDTLTLVKNSAFGRAFNTTGITVSDTSNSGSNPDTNGNGVWNEAADNVPTILSIPNTSLFIPGGFSPDGDGKNDFFVIKGLSSVIDNSFTVYNRWGTKVYSKNNYDNTWNGYPNVSGTLGNEKLPQGTYYYILEFKNGDTKPMNGFIVIQY
ncbi:MAG: conserved repeat domain protein [Bacteroidetes bacterium]|nr:conserved repeat domain protein [Bacteroidota bacterium]